GAMRKENVKTSHLLHLSTIADSKISGQPWVKFQSAGWVNIQSAPTHNRALPKVDQSLRRLRLVACRFAPYGFV
ncbi:MAG: hypothetical protein NT083_10870, partial [Rhodocyclales bacterium]|nr:hypothetical protein [Rhodocyclales bacterium]